MTNDLPSLPPSPDAVSPPADPPAPPAHTEEAALAATGEGVAAAAAETPVTEPTPSAADEPPPEEPPAATDEAEPTPEEPAPAETPSNKHWYVVKVQSGREETIKEAIERRVKIEGLEEFFGQIVIPVEKVVEMRSSKRVTRERKLYPGYLMAEVEYNDRILYLFRETSGVGDFVGAGVNRAPTPMTPREVERMIRKTGDKQEDVKEVHGKPPVDRGDRVKVKDGIFAGMEGEVKEILESKSQVRVELVIFGRPVPHDLEYWQVEPA
jgi:transcriptional antiterminator NusG